MSTLDPTGKTVKIGEDNLVRIDGIGVFRRVERDGVVCLQFMDTDRYRAKCRGSKFIEVPLHILVSIISPTVKGTSNEPGQSTSPAQP